MTDLYWDTVTSNDSKIAVLRTVVEDGHLTTTWGHSVTSDTIDWPTCPYCGCRQAITMYDFRGNPEFERGVAAIAMLGFVCGLVVMMYAEVPDVWEAKTACGACYGVK